MFSEKLYEMLFEVWGRSKPAKETKIWANYPDILVKVCIFYSNISLRPF